MHKSKLLDMLRRLSGRQLSRFGEFLASPYFNKSPSNISFFDYLYPFAPDFDHPDLAKERVLVRWPGEGEPSTKALAYLMSNLTGLLEQFLAVEHFLADDFQQNLALLQHSRDLEMELTYQRARRQLDKLLEAYDWRDADYHHQRYLLLRLDQEQADRHRQTYRPELQEAADALDLYYLLQKMRYSWMMVHLEDMLNVRYEHYFESVLLELSADHPFADIPAVTVYRTALQMVRNYEDTATFDRLQALLAEHGRLFPPAERKGLYTGLLNFCTRRINRYADERFREAYLDINIALLEDGLLLEGGELSPWRYTNLVAAALRCGRTEWARTFLEEQRVNLPANYADNIYRYNLGYFFYQTGQLDDAQRTLAQVEFEDVFFNISLRSLLTRVYYEAGEEELLFAYLEANRLFLLRNDLIEAHLKTQMHNFLDFTRRLARIGPHNAGELPALLESLPPAREVMHREWLERMGRLKEG